MEEMRGAVCAREGVTQFQPGAACPYPAEGNKADWREPSCIGFNAVYPSPFHVNSDKVSKLSDS